MGIFDRLFGKKKEVPKRKPATPSKTYFKTNSTDHNLGQIDLTVMGKLRVDGLLAIAEMEKIAKRKGLNFAFHVMYTTLFEEGVLTVPVVCTIGEINYSLYFIYQKEDLAKYKDLVSQIERTLYPNLIYFSTIPIEDNVEAQSALSTFQMANLRVFTDAPVAGQFSMWWQSENDKYFHKSKTFRLLQRIYKLCQGYETYLMGYILLQIGVTNEAKLQRMRLPKENVSYILNAPEHNRIILNLSQEKGIRFLFPIERTSAKYRDLFLQGVVSDFEMVIRSLKEQNVPSDEKQEPNGYEWFSFMSNVVKQKEEQGEPIDQIGTLNLNSKLN